MSATKEAFARLSATLPEGACLDCALNKEQGRGACLEHACEYVMATGERCDLPRVAGSTYCSQSHEDSAKHNALARQFLAYRELPLVVAEDEQEEAA